MTTDIVINVIMCSYMTRITSYRHLLHIITTGTNFYSCKVWWIYK